MAIFTKYEFWHYYFNELKTQNIPLYIISGIFRKDQIFFKSYGNFYRNILKNVTHFFVQNKESEKLLNSININAVSLSGDTRFDRVYENALNPKDLNEVKAFCQNKPVLVCGSTWPEDENLLAKLAQNNPDWKFILAPHEIHQSHIENIVSTFSNHVYTNKIIKYSEIKVGDLNTTQILIIDNIGMLSSLYQFGKIAYIGGGFGAGIHNTLEAVAFGLPVIFGPKYHKFQEAKDLIELDIAKSINNETELLNAFDYFEFNNDANQIALKYIEEKKGATKSIINSIFK
jgi:3-deoxy-D-manno-octulosonic-acid transferase